MIETVLEGLSEEVPGFLYSAVVDMEMAEPLGEVSARDARALDGTLASALYTDMVRSHLRNIDHLGGEEALGHTSDIFIATDKYYLILRPMPSVMCYQSLFINRNGNLGSARAALQRSSEAIEGFLRQG